MADFRDTFGQDSFAPSNVLPVEVQQGGQRDPRASRMLNVNNRHFANQVSGFPVNQFDSTGVPRLDIIQALVNRMMTERGFK